MRLIIAPITLKAANDFIIEHHRHHKRVQGCKFAVCVKLNEEVVGVAICGRPVSRHRDDGLTVEITRLATDGTRNACSKLLSACKRIAFHMGYSKLITYTLPEESGSSLKGAGFKEIGLNRGGVGMYLADQERISIQSVRK